jgi:hypothetical protein
MRKYRFTVKGLPPKKDGANSMWGKDLEADRLIKLRIAAAMAFGDDPPLRDSINLEVSVNIPQNGRTIGDLDNFITGICDGLMACDQRSKLSPLFNNPEYGDVHPTKALGMVDNNEIISIAAKKVIGECQELFYTVSISGG